VTSVGSRASPVVRSGLKVGRLPLLIGGMLALLAGVTGGLLRAGLQVPVLRADHAALHAALMIGGFFGTVIALERAAAHGRTPAYGAPGCAVAATLTLVFADAPQLAVVLLLVSGVVLTWVTWQLHQRQPQLHSWVLLAGAACFPLGTLLWLVTGGFDAALGFWIDFLVLTIAGERLELSRLMRPAPGARRGFVAIAGLVVAGAALWPVHAQAGQAVTGTALCLLGFWLLRHDIARRTARAFGLTGFIGRTLLIGHVWLLVSGVLMTGWSLALAPGLRDAALHAVLLGFVMSMVFAHAPIIFPVLLGVAMRHHAGAWVPVALLNVSLLLRVAADLVGHAGLRAAGTAGNAVALGVFVLSTVAAIALGRRTRVAS
jgi:hypothetical protein